MSLTGNVYFGGQNLENTHPLEQIEIDMTNLQNDITENSANIELNTILINQNTTDILTNKNNITSHTSTLASHTTSINANTLALSGISYNNTLNADLTTIDNHLLIKAVNGWNWDQKGAHLLIQNSSLETPNQYSIGVYAGTEYGVHFRSLIADEQGSCCIVNTRNNAVEDSSSIVLCGMHANVKKGLKIALNGSNSEYHGGSFVFYTSVFIQTAGNLMMDVYNTMAGNITRGTNNASAITAIQGVNTTQDGRLTNVEQKTMFQTCNGTNETRFTSHVLGLNFYSTDSRYNGGNTSIISNYQAILNLQTVNTTQDTRLTNIETVNTTQTSNISSNAGAIASLHSDMLDNRGDIIINHADIVNNYNYILAIQTVNTTQDTRLTNIETLNTTQNTRLTNIETLNTTQNTRLSDVEFLNTAQNTRLTNLETAPSSKYTAGRGSFNTTGMTTPNALNVWDTLNMDTLPTAYVGGSPNAPAGRNRIRLTTAGVYKIIFSFTYATVSSNGSDWDITHRMRLNTVDSTTYTPIVASRIFDVRGSGNCCYGSDYTSMNPDNLILYSNTANDWIMQYRTRTDSGGNIRPNRFNLCVSFSHSGITSDYFLQTYSSQIRSLVDCRYVLTYEAY
jgi:hypothetical protein